jgi:hypothetical protein
MIFDLRRVRAVAAVALCALALTACSDDDDPVQPPFATATVSAASTGETSIRVTWAAAPNAESYVVERAAGAAGAFAQVTTTAGTVTQYDDTGLQAGTTYRYRVITRRGTLSSTASQEASVTLAAAALAVPGNVQVSALSPTRIQVTFGAVPNATSYVVERAAGTGGTFAQVGTATGTTFVDSVGVTPGTAYQYRVQATAQGRPSSAFSAAAAVSAPNRTAVALPLVIRQDTRLSADTLYQLTGYTKVLNGATLTIPAGTTILGGAGNAATGGVGGSLFVYRGARLVVEGTAQSPVVFTSGRPAGQRAAGDWGGIVIVGRARTNRTGGSVLTESPSPLVNETDGTGGTQQQYNNGTDDDDDSGSLRYVRIEFAGFAVSQDNELNSLSMYAVGRRTRLEYVQALMGLDDAFEWFGGTVDGRYLVSYETGDDHFDTSEGYRGRNQFLIGYQSFVPAPNPSGSAGGAATDPVFFEADGCQGTGCPANFASTPYSMPVFANFTIVGTGPGVLPAPNGGYGIVARRGTGGTWVNGILARLGNRAVNVRDAFTDTLLTRDSLSLRSLYLAENVANFDPAGSAQFGQAARFATAAVDTAATGTTAASLFTALPAVGTVATTAALDWRPAATAPAAIRTGGLATFAAPLTGRMAGFFGGTVQATSYRGAVDPAAQTPWYAGWTVYSRN